ncbi:CHASE2 domain-containing protein, partial [Salmonella enterica]|uniref:CHASE2 domain-containing protein n=1 Tax=Salmonella enterica TaxID=28901 RepID=UPI003D286EC1
ARLLNLPGYPASGPFSFKNKIVVVGNTVTDIHRTPMSNNMFGPEVVASALDMALNDRVLIQKAPAALQWLLVAGLVAAIG